MKPAGLLSLSLVLLTLFSHLISTERAWWVNSMPLLNSDWVYIYISRICFYWKLKNIVALTFWFQTFQAPLFETPKADPKNVASIILGGGAGTRLFPLTGRRAKPAVRYQLFSFEIDCVTLIIKKRMKFFNMEAPILGINKPIILVYESFLWSWV